MKILFLPFEVIKFIREIFEKRHLIYELVKRDFKSRYTGSYMGLLWTILQPLMMMLIMWVVFSFGLRGGKMAGGVSFIAYMFSAQIAFVFFSEAMNSSTNVIWEYSFLVKKVNFRLSVLPIVKLISALIIHSIFLIIVVVMNGIGGVYPSIYYLQIPYYIMCLMLLALGLGWITSSINVFIRDITNVVQIVLQFAFWLTPIFWNPALLPESMRKYVFLNPLSYIVSGYRDCLLYQKPFWKADPVMTACFWGFTIISLLLGITIFRKLRPHFADVI